MGHRVSIWIFVSWRDRAIKIAWPGSCESNNTSAVCGYKAPRTISGRPSIIAANRLQREFTVELPDRAWVTDITYIRTWQGWLYLAVVIDLYSRKVVGWSMKPTLAKNLLLDALMMAVWRRKPKTRHRSLRSGLAIWQ